MRPSLRALVPILLAFCLAFPQLADAGRRSHGSHPSSSLKYSGTHWYRASRVKPMHISHPGLIRAHAIHHPQYLSSSAATRNSRGRIKRSEAAKREFMKQTGYPHGRPGYVVDHVVALSLGGADAPGNMQWQTKEEGKAKDKWERGGHPSSKRLKSYRRTSY